MNMKDVVLPERLQVNAEFHAASAKISFYGFCARCGLRFFAR